MTFDEVAEQQDRMNYAVYKFQHDQMDKLMFEAFSGLEWNSPLPSYDDLIKSKERNK